MILHVVLSRHGVSELGWSGHILNLFLIVCNVSQPNRMLQRTNLACPMTSHGPGVQPGCRIEIKALQKSGFSSSGDMDYAIHIILQF